MDIYQIALAGFLATTAMTIVMSLITWSGFANADIVRGVGSLATRRLESSVVPGLVIHMTVGMIFAYLYASVINLMGTQSPAYILSLAVGIGLWHGIVTSWGIAVLVSKFHPLPKFQNMGPKEIGSHVLGHLVFGFVVGLVLSQAIGTQAT